MPRAAPRTAIVQSVFDVTPNMRRIVFGGAGFADFPAGAEGGYIKLVFPDQPRTNPDRPVMRTYSVRAHDPSTGAVSVDFAMHDDTGGIAIDWAARAQPGDVLPIGGPGSVKMVPPQADWYLIAADMTGLPAALCNLERLPAHARGYAVLEITSEQDIQAIPVPDGMDVRWVVDPAPQALNNTLLDAIKALDWLDGGPFVWTACEFDTMRALRGYYRTEKGVDRTNIYLSSYWRSGRTEDQHKVDKSKEKETA